MLTYNATIKDRLVTIYILYILASCVKNYNYVKQTKWKDLNWSTINSIVYKFQNEIFKNAKQKNENRMRYFQKCLVNSKEAKLLAVRIVTQDNRGKRTAGVDGVSNVAPNLRINLANELVMDGNCSEIKRIFIPKADGKLRPLGIPTIKDRSKQCLLKMALEPEWESKFEHNSYGFRPGYSTADAKWVVARQLQGKPKFFLDADIEGCFDNIDHKYLLKKLKTMKSFENQIRSWLKAGIMIDGHVEDNDTGTPQGGIISPLLMNIALHGMENFVMEHFPRRNEAKLVRYADDLVVFTQNEKNALKAKELVNTFLEPIGLNLSEAKTTIGSSIDKLNGREPGIDFLGYHFRNVRCSIHRGVKSTRNTRMNFRLITHPSRKAVKNHKNNLRVTLKKYKTAPLEKVIERVSSIVRGWAWYHSVTQCHSTFSKMDAWLWKRLWKWACVRYKSRTRAKENCFSVEGKGWAFGFTNRETKKTYILKRHDQHGIRKHLKIKAGSSIYNAEDILYFSKRLPFTHSHNLRFGRLLKNQNYSCPVCNQMFLPDEVLELHHVINAEGVRIGPVQLVHGHCHDQIHAKRLANPNQK